MSKTKSKKARKNNRALYAIACRRYFSFFMKEAFNVVNPGTKFESNWHLYLIAHHLRAVLDGRIKRLIINVPPRSLKSTIISVCWPAWIVGNNPSKRIICASYSQHLSDKLAVDSRYLMQSRLFSEAFPKVKIMPDQNKKNKFIVSERGFRFSTSVGGSVTGEGGDILILDDPHNALDIHSDKKRQKAINWFRQSFVSRLDDKANGAIVVVMQRLHEQDLTGFLLQNQPDDWHVLSIPAIASEEIQYDFDKFAYLYKKDELLYKNKETLGNMEQLKKELGSYAFNAQYLQNPTALNSGMVSHKWIKYYSRPISIMVFDNIVQSWDTAIKSGDGNSYSVCTTWGKNSGKYYLLDVYRDKVEYPALRNKIIELREKWRPDRILIEDKASGQSLLQDLKQDSTILPLVPIRVHQDKLTRFARVTPLFEYGDILINKDSNWRFEYEQEILSFPNSRNNDQVDSTSQYLNYILGERITPRIRQL